MNLSSSTAKFVPYEIRPSKQVERRILMEIIQLTRDAGYPIKNYKYVGFGGIKFVDFLLMHRYVGFAAYTSVEHDETIRQRCKYNKPFDHIKLHEGSLSDYLIKRKVKMKSVNWFDYDSSISKDIVDDIVTCGSKVENGSLLFFTISADPTRNWKGMKPDQRKLKFEEEFGDAAAGFVTKDFTNEEFRNTSSKVLLKLIRKAFSGRANSNFHPLLQTLYRDSAWMCTIGGIVEEDIKAEVVRLRNGIKSCLPGFFVEDYSDEFQEIPQINITETERQLLDVIVTQKTNNGPKRKLAKSLGFDEEYLEKYKKVLRFVPRYIESST